MQGRGGVRQEFEKGGGGVWEGWLGIVWEKQLQDFKGPAHSKNENSYCPTKHTVRVEASCKKTLVQ